MKEKSPLPLTDPRDVVPHADREISTVTMINW